MHDLISQKLAVFDAMQDDFVTAFQFVQRMHGQRRFPTVPVSETVFYLHALWICECKDRLLSVPKTIRRYEGKQCLKLLAGWQLGDTASVIAFLHRKLDMQSFAEITHQIQVAWQQNSIPLAQRLEHGRRVLLDRGFNLHIMLDAIFALSQQDLAREVHQACQKLGHAQEQIDHQLTALESRLYMFMPQQELAQRNMRIMNAMGINIVDRPQDEPGHRTWRVEKPELPPGPFASTPIDGYREMTAPRYNNPKQVRFVDHPDTLDSGVIVGETFAPTERQ